MSMRKYSQNYLLNVPGWWVPVNPYFPEKLLVLGSWAPAIHGLTMALEYAIFVKRDYFLARSLLRLLRHCYEMEVRRFRVYYGASYLSDALHDEKHSCHPVAKALVELEEYMQEADKAIEALSPSYEEDTEDETEEAEEEEYCEEEEEED